MAVKSLQVNTIVAKLIIAAAALLCLTAVIFVVRWGLGNTLSKETQNKELASMAIDFAPDDPQPYYTLAAINEKTFVLDDLPKAMQGYEKAVSLAPNDFRLWLALGKARERTGDTVGAEKALRKALELAPNYAEIHWILGNQLLRQGNAEEAFIEIRKAVEQNKTYANPAVVTAWQIFDGDVDQISQKIGDSAPIKAGLAPFLAKQSRFDEALFFWNSVPNDEKSTTYKANGEGILAQLIAQKKYRQALETRAQIYPSTDEKFIVGNVFNGDFERDVKIANANVFDWQIAAGQQPQIGLDDSQKHAGNKSLVMIFNSATGQEFRPIQQIIAVESGKAYKFETFYRSDLKTAATVNWQITDANDGKVLASTEAVANSAEWSPLTAEFTVPAATQAISLKLVRSACQQTICPITGKVWFDDVKLK